MMKEITYDIDKSIAVLETYNTGWRKELNFVSWNGGVLKYDIRDWDREHKRMSRGATLTEEEMRKLVSAMNEVYAHRTDVLASVAPNEEKDTCMTYPDEIPYEIVERIATIGEYPTGWKRELNILIWNVGRAKYDLRDWDPPHTHMSRGVTLTEEQMKKLVSAMNEEFAQEAGE